MIFALRGRKDATLDEGAMCGSGGETQPRICYASGMRRRLFLIGLLVVTACGSDGTPATVTNSPASAGCDAEGEQTRRHDENLR